MKTHFQNVLILLFAFFSLKGSSQHFQNIWIGNPFQPMNIIVQDAQINDVSIGIGDEIAVFDEDENGDFICVGATVVQQVVSPTNPLIIIASTDDGTTVDVDGFVDGHDIVFKIWDTSESEEISTITADFNSSFNSVYTSLGTALVQITNCQMGDIDCDCDIDILDITQVAYRFGTEYGDDLFDPAFDFDNDGDIDIVDITMVAYWFGWSCDG